MSLKKVISLFALAAPLLAGCNSAAPASNAPAMVVDPIPKAGAPGGMGVPPTGMAPSGGTVPR